MNLFVERRLSTAWRKVRLKSAVRLKSDRETGNSSSENYVGLENIESWTGRLINPNRNEAQPEEKESSDKGVVASFEAGDVLFGKLRPYLAKAHLAEKAGICTTELLVLEPLEDLHGRFLLNAILTNEFIDRVNATTFGARMPRADWNTISNLVIPVPPLPQQRQIVDYLDRETQKIDALIAAKKRLLGLLGEKRRSLITYAVTRGLKTDAPMKHSGMEWLGEIPEDWKVVSLTFLAQVRTGVTKGRNLGDAEIVRVPYLRVANVQDGYVDLDDVADIEVLLEEIASFSLRKGDVLMNEGGDADKLGRGAVWNEEIEPCLHQNHVFAVRCYGVEPEWLATVTSSSYAKAYFESRAKQSTNLASISSTNLKELPVVLPPRSIQLRIVNELRNLLTKLDSLCNATDTTIALLQERRTSLISAAVTGQLQIPD